MNTFLYIIVAEVFVIAVVISVTLVALSWRRKKRLLSSLDTMLTEITASESERKKSFMNRLIQSFQLQEDQADTLSTQFLKEEKLVYHNLLKIQLDQTPKAIEDFRNQLVLSIESCLENLAQLIPNRAEPQSEASQQPPETTTADHNPAYDGDIEMAPPTDTQDLSGEDTESMNQDGSGNQAPEPVTTEESDSDNLGDQNTLSPDIDSETDQDSPEAKPSISDQPSPPESADSPVSEDITKSDSTPANTESTVDSEPSWDDAFEEAGVKN